MDPIIKTSAQMGAGIGLRRPHYTEILQTQRPVGWVELISENFIDFGGKPRWTARKAAEKWPVICHGVELNLGSTDPFQEDYVQNLKELLKEMRSPWFSDHLCFSASASHHFHDLLPVPRTPESLENIVSRVNRAQDIFAIPFAIENISAYAESPDWLFKETDFINTILEKTGCWLLLDVNNIYVNSQNYRFNAHAYIDAIRLDRVIQIHLAGHDLMDTQAAEKLIIDTHGSHVCPEVWDLYQYTLRKLGRPVATLIEWDNELPTLDGLLDERDKAQSILNDLFSKKSHEVSLGA